MAEQANGNAKANWEGRIRPILDKMRSGDIAGVRSDLGLGNPFGQANPFGDASAAGPSAAPMAKTSPAMKLWWEEPEGERPAFGQPGWNLEEGERPVWPWRGWNQPEEVPEVLFSEGPYAQYAPDIGEAGMVEPGLAAGFAEGLPEGMHAAFAASAQQTNEMNRLRQQWFDQWKNLMSQAYGQYTQNLVSGLGLFT